MFSDSNSLTLKIEIYRCTKIKCIFLGGCFVSLVLKEENTAQNWPVNENTKVLAVVSRVLYKDTHSTCLSPSYEHVQINWTGQRIEKKHRTFIRVLIIDYSDWIYLSDSDGCTCALWTRVRIQTLFSITVSWSSSFRHKTSSNIIRQQHEHDPLTSGHY